MSRFSSAVVISILGFSFANACSDKKNDDGDEDPTQTTGIITGGTSAGGNSGTGTNSGTNSGTGGTGGGSGGNGGSFTDACPNLPENLGACGESAVNSKPKPVNMLIVLDKSGSMAQDAQGQQKWGAMKSALNSALGEVASSINFGLELYPTPNLNSDVIDRQSCGQDGNCCEMPEHGDMNVPVGTGSEAVNMILDTLDNTEPGGGTPTARALERALEYFTSGAGANLEGDKYVLLATDGGPNCNEELNCGRDLCTYNLDDPQRDCTTTSTDNNCCEFTSAGCVDSNNVVDRINLLADAGINTFVVGIPGSEAYSDFLKDFADAGNQPSGDPDYSYYRVDDISDLTSVFNEITVQLVTSCDLEIPQVPAVPPVVVIDCEQVNKIGGAGGEGGSSNSDKENWTWQPGSQEIKLVGDTCDRVQKGVGRIDILLDCDVPQ